MSKDTIFHSANQVLYGIVKDMRRQGLDTTKHKDPIAPADINKMYSSGTLSNNNPTALQYKVWFDLSFHFGRRGREGLRELRKYSFVIKTDAENREYIVNAYNEKEKNHQGVSNKEEEKQANMYAQPGDPKCPVESYKLYISKLNPSHNALFQRPKKNKNFNKSDQWWYDNVAVGANTLGAFMKTISKCASLSQEYTNHVLGKKQQPHSTELDWILKGLVR